MNQREQPLELVGCPDCEAVVDAGASRCWLCGRKLDLAKPVAPKLSTGQPNLPSGATALVLIAMLVVMAIGVFALAPGAGILFLVLVAPALLATVVASNRQRARGVTTGWGQTFGTFMMSMAAILGGVTILGLAAFVAFVICCLATFSGDFR